MKLRKILVVAWMFILIICFCGCISEKAEKNSVFRRFVSPLYGAKPLLDLSNPALLSFRDEIIDNRNVNVSRTLISPEFMTHNISIVQPIRIRHNHRYTGISFLIRSTSAPSAFTLILMPKDPPSSLYAYTKPLALKHTDWKRIDLTFSDFSHSATFLNLDIDSFNPVYWDEVEFLLVFLEGPGENFFVDWGPVDLVHQRNRYRFF